jgi:hypothetical protein
MLPNWRRVLRKAAGQDGPPGDEEAGFFGWVGGVIWGDFSQIKAGEGEHSPHRNSPCFHLTIPHRPGKWQIFFVEMFY